jgi:hypothetical protein
VDFEDGWDFDGAELFELCAHPAKQQHIRKRIRLRMYLF